MSLKPIERSGRSFSLRLNLWYAAFFIFGCFALFLLAYFVLASFIQQKEKEVIRAKLDEYRAWYENGGLAALSDNFVNSRRRDITCGIASPYSSVPQGGTAATGEIGTPELA